MEPTTTNTPIFSNYEFRDILLTFLFKTIKGDYKNPQALKRAINKAYNRHGIDSTQRDGLLMSLELEGEPKGTRYKREELLALLEMLLKDNYITTLDYAVALSLGASKELFSEFTISKYLEEHKIDLDTLDEPLNDIVRDLESL